MTFTQLLNCSSPFHFYVILNKFLSCTFHIFHSLMISFSIALENFFSVKPLGKSTLHSCEKHKTQKSQQLVPIHILRMIQKMITTKRYSGNRFFSSDLCCVWHFSVVKSSCGSFESSRTKQICQAQMCAHRICFIVYESQFAVVLFLLFIFQ
jgi:hypothetical protein